MVGLQIVGPPRFGSGLHHYLVSVGSGGLLGAGGQPAGGRFFRSASLTRSCQSPSRRRRAGVGPGGFLAGGVLGDFFRVVFFFRISE